MSDILFKLNINSIQGLMMYQSMRIPRGGLVISGGSNKGFTDHLRDSHQNYRTFSKC